MMGSFSHLKEKCSGCEKEEVNYTKEHVFPQWLILKTNTDKTRINWFNETKLPALSCTIPLCEECNKIFGKELEGPVSKLFEDIESFKGLSDNEAELLVRWMWKISGLFWAAACPQGKYTEKYTLRERVLSPIDEIRGDIIIALSLIDNIDLSYGDLPLGLDALCEIDAIFVAGVFSKIAIIISLAGFEEVIPENYSIYHLESVRQENIETKVLFPKQGFKNDSEAVYVTKTIGELLAVVHDELAIELYRRKINGVV